MSTCSMTSLFLLGPERQGGKKSMNGRREGQRVIRRQQYPQKEWVRNYLEREIGRNSKFTLKLPFSNEIFDIGKL